MLWYTVIIYKFTQGNLGAKKIGRSRFQLPVKKKNRKLRHWRPTAQSLILAPITTILVKTFSNGGGGCTVHSRFTEASRSQSTFESFKYLIITDLDTYTSAKI